MEFLQAILCVWNRRNFARRYKKATKQFDRACLAIIGERRTLFEEVNKWRVKKTKESQLETTVTTSADVTIMSVEGIYRKLFHEDTPPLEDPTGMMREGGPDPPTPSFAAEQIAIRLEELKNPEGLLLDYHIADTSL